MQTPTYSVSNDNITIYSSYQIQKCEFKNILKIIAEQYPNHEVVKTRFYYSAICEWTTHNFLYNLGLWKTHTNNVDINTMRWYSKLMYYIVGTLSYPFIK